MKENVRIVQLIDSLDAGGAERMAVNYANVLSKTIAFSGLITSRKEGELKKELSENVVYLFAAKEKAIDVSAVQKIRHFIKENKVDLLHAHGTSFFLAVLIKLTYPRLKVIWHDHNGNRIKSKSWINRLLSVFSFFFSGVIAVNQDLEGWAKKHLYTKKIRYFPNFISTKASVVPPITQLKGEAGKRMIFLANLRYPKNHITFLEAFRISSAIQEGWTLHLIGKDYEDTYSDQIKYFIKKHNLEKIIYLYNACSDIEAILQQGQIGVLSSVYEGFPVTLLEYGKAQLCVLSTNVGYCKAVIDDKKNGLLFNPTDGLMISEAINEVIGDKEKRIFLSKALSEKVEARFSDKTIIRQYLEWIEFS